jgi:flagellar motility protein MotE (MotC chaperone)
MNAALRFYRLLQSYEELTRLEVFALKEDNLPYLNRLQARKRPLADKLATMRREARLSEAESRRVDDRLRTLQATEQKNLELIELAMKTVSESLAGLSRTRSRSGRLRRTYVQGTPRAARALAGTA